jgi:hypothetical protein
LPAPQDPGDERVIHSWVFVHRKCASQRLLTSLDGALRDYRGVNAASWVTALGVVVALIIGLSTVVQRRRAERETQWWNRTQWALDISLNADDQAKLELGLDVLDYIAGSKITTAEQAQFIRIAAERIVGQRLGLDAEDARGDQ